MDKLSEHAIRMLEIAEGENDFFRNDDKRQADIARAVYDLILQVQMLKEVNRKERSSEKPNNCETCKHFQEKADTYMKQCEFYFMDCKYEPKDEPQTERSNNADHIE